MIDKNYGKFYTTCDVCGEELPPTSTFEEARSQAEEAGWEVKHYDTDWVNICPDCIEEV